MDKIATFELPKWIRDQKGHASLILSGSATPALSIRDLIELSSDRDKTTLNLSVESLSLSLGSGNGSEPLRKAIAALYNEAITEDHVLTTNGATGANSLVFQSLLKPGDHVISLYPTYTQLLSMPEAITGVEVSLWKLSLDDQAAASIQSLEDMIRPTTRMIVFNNPNNPTGTIMDADLHRKIVALARSRGIFVLVDEIFRPLFHNPKDGVPPSVVELSEEYTNVIVTGSLSKAGVYRASESVGL
ncbi:uncharacterized protein N7459_003102 [Penicillium hispanicum]|uniref:uncharacterized protein n=1 Tax=Penicillium hispanicum TaxID=1080232 RepID=UPI002540B8F9|nr:uncharacterized protein N7459_003102 [Penicillium hispanicum]KAJ5587337.1 hypothetical protein N7459_003102 [Penicillium hispanicum]